MGSEACGSGPCRPSLALFERSEWATADRVGCRPGLRTGAPRPEPAVSGLWAALTERERTGTSNFSGGEPFIITDRAVEIRLIDAIRLASGSSGAPVSRRLARSVWRDSRGWPRTDLNLALAGIGGTVGAKQSFALPGRAFARRHRSRALAGRRWCVWDGTLRWPVAAGCEPASHYRRDADAPQLASLAAGCYNSARNAGGVRRTE